MQWHEKCKSQIHNTWTPESLIQVWILCNEILNLERHTDKEELTSDYRKGNSIIKIRERDG